VHTTPTPMDQYMVDLDERPWAAYAACRSADPEIFFAGTDTASFEAVKICRSCPVQDQCLAWALDNRVRYGVWGGLTERQRRRATRRSA
jgi:WhiB family transcriptional regulator, redox-sensing transcriptional regulator